MAIIIVLGAVLKLEVSLNREKGLESKACNKKKLDKLHFEAAPPTNIKNNKEKEKGSEARGLGHKDMK